MGKQSNPKKFTPPRSPRAAGNSGIFSDSGKGQKRDPQPNGSKEQSILRNAIKNHNRKVGG